MRVDKSREDDSSFRWSPEPRTSPEESDPSDVQTARPRVLLTDTDRRPYAARLALVLSESGCEVSALCSAYGHPLLKTGSVNSTFAYSAVRPLDALEQAIERIDPDLVIPCDDRGVRHLHELYARMIREQRATGKIALLIERSLGSPESYATVSCRYELLRVAREEGLRVPRTELISKIEDLHALQSSQPLPWVLKADESWGGRGVRVAHASDEVEPFFRDISNPFRFRRALKRMVVNRDPFWLQPWWEGRQPAVIVQAFVPGRPANCAVACWEGRVLAGIGVEVVSTEGPTGPATIVRVVENQEMMLCAERLARRLQLSGLFGLDFIIEDGSNHANLIEMNPRATPLCHLRLGTGRDLVAALWAELSHRPVPATISVTDKEMIAYFPQAWHSHSDLLETSYQDVPPGNPEFLDEFLRPWPVRSWMFRLTARLQRVKDDSARILGGAFGSGRRG